MDRLCKGAETVTCFRSGSMKLSLWPRQCGVAATLLTILCGVVTLVTVDFSASSSPQRRLEWLLGSEPGQITKAAWRTRQHLPPPSQVPENVVKSQLGSAPESAEVPHSAASPSEEESIPSSTDGGYVDSAPTPIEDLVASVGGSDNEEKVDTAASPSEAEFHESGAWDSVAEAPAPESSVEESAQRPPSIKWNYDVCLVVTMGRSGTRTNRQALPYSELYRLFNAARGLKKGKLFVGTNADPTIFCKMVRDALGSSAECSTYNRVDVTTNKVTISQPPLALGNRFPCLILPNSYRWRPISVFTLFSLQSSSASISWWERRRSTRHNPPSGNCKSMVSGGTRCNPWTLTVKIQPESLHRCPSRSGDQP